MPRKPRINLVDIVDRLVTLYGPVYAELFKDHPEAYGIHGFIGRDGPAALLVNEDGRGYRDDGFEIKAKEALKPLVAKTYELAAACKITGGQFPPRLHVDLDRKEDGKVYLRAMINDGLGAVLVKREALVFSNHGWGFFCSPAEYAMMAFSENKKEIDNVIHAAKAGLDEAIDFVIEADLVHIQKGRHAGIVRKFANLFPTDGKTHISRIVKQAVWVMAVSNQQPYKLMVSAEAREEMEGVKFDGAEYETLETEDAAPRFMH